MIKGEIKMDTPTTFYISPHGDDRWSGRLPAPDASQADLEAGFEARGDGLWGVYRFKRGFGGQVLRTRGAWDFAYQPALYRLYRWWAARRSIA